jgi:tRNA threonylcarbamoyladenosine biosynthesis protein TsaB
MQLPLAMSLRLGKPGRMDGAKRIVAIETSGRHGSVAALWGDIDQSHVVGQISLTGDQRTAQALVPALQRLLIAAGWMTKSIELIAAAVGPGSFTGLRIGVTTAKTFAYAVGAEVIGVNTLAALATQAPAGNASLWTILDAQRQELFAARFAIDDAGQLQAEHEATIVPNADWLFNLQPGDRVIGPPLARLEPQLPIGVEVISSALWQPMAAAVGRVAWSAYQSGQRDDLWQLAPNYYRTSAAEEKATRT